MHTKLYQSHAQCIRLLSYLVPKCYHQHILDTCLISEYEDSPSVDTIPHLHRFLTSRICVLGKAALPSRRKTVVEKYPAVLDCLIDTNLPSENVIYSWTKNGEDASSDARVTIIASGALFIKSTRRTDSGVYICIAKTFDSSGLVTYPGTDIMLDVQCKLIAIKTCCPN